MATFTSYIPTDMLDPGYFYTVTPDKVLVANATEVRLQTPEGDIQSYQGHFSYYSNGNLNWYGSTLNAVVDYDSSGNELDRATGLSISGTTYNSYASANNFYGLKTYAFSGNDVINGSQYSDTLDGFNGNDIVYGNGGNDLLIGEAGNDILYGGDGKDLLVGGSSNDWINGGTDLDTAYYSGSSSQYDIAGGSDYAAIADKVSGRDGSDVLIGVERLHFSNTNIALDKGAGENAGEAYRMYKAALDREPDVIGLGAWISVLDNGASLEHVAGGFIDSIEFEEKYGEDPSNERFVTLLYNNVLNRDPDPEGFAGWTGVLNRGESKESVLIGFSESIENINNTTAQLIGISYQEWLG